MASRTGILSDAHSDKFCLEFSAGPMSYFQANYHELPPNPNLPGIKLPRYVQTAQKPQSLAIAAVNIGKLLHKNNHMSSSFVLEKMALNMKDYIPTQVALAPSIGTQSLQVSHISLASLSGSSRGDQLMAQVSGSSGYPSTHSSTPPTNGHGYHTPSGSVPSAGSAPHSNGSSASEDDVDLYTGGVAQRQTAQEQQRAEVRAAAESALFDDVFNPVPTPLVRYNPTTQRVERPIPGFSHADTEIARQSDPGLARTRSAAHLAIFREQRQQSASLGDYFGPSIPLPQRPTSYTMSVDERGNQRL